MLGADKRVKMSKFLSYVLRHHPESIGLTLDNHGWIPIKDLLEACRENKTTLTRDDLQDIVDMCPKKRFAVSDDGKKVRANQGHSVKIDLDYTLAEPPELLYHGTGMKAKDIITLAGIDKMQRTHVHLSSDILTAYSVGQRHGKPVIFVIAAKKMYDAGYVFYLSDNGVWLTNDVPPQYFIRIEYGP